MTTNPPSRTVRCFASIHCASAANASGVSECSTSSIPTTASAWDVKAMFARFMARLAGAALAVAACPSYALAADNILTVGLIAPTSVEQALQSWKPLTEGLARELRMPVKVVASKNYSEIADALIDGRVQLAWLNNRLAIDAVDMDQAQVFAQMVRLDGHSGYKSVLLARREGAIQSITDILGKPGAYRFGSGDRKSTSGFLVPNYYVFAKNKIDPARHFAKVTHGSHRDNFLAIADGQVDVAVNNTEDLELFRAEFPDRFAKVRVIWESPLIPGDPLLYRKDLPTATQQKIRRVILGYGKDDTEKAALKAIKMLSGFKASSNYQLRPVVDIEMFDALTNAMASQNLAPANFRATMDQLTKRAARLDTLLNSTRLESP